MVRKYKRLYHDFNRNSYFEDIKNWMSSGLQNKWNNLFVALVFVLGLSLGAYITYKLMGG